MNPPVQTTRMAFCHLALYAVVAVCMTLSPHIHRLHTSDSLIPVLASLYAWEPFFWGQDRVGLLWPLLAMPVTSPLANLLLQTFVVAFCALAAPLLLGYVVFPRSSAVPLAAGLANAWYLATAPELFIQNHFLSSYHASATALGCLGLLLLRPAASARWRWAQLALAGSLLALAHWVYIAVVFFLLPTAIVRGWTKPGATTPILTKMSASRLLQPLLDSVSRAGILLTLTGFAIGYAAMRVLAEKASGSTSMGALPPDQWGNSLFQFLKVVTTLPGSDLWLSGLGLACVVGLVSTLAAGSRTRWVIGTTVGLFLVGLAEAGVLATRKWCDMNLHHPRYILGLITAWQLACASLLAAPVAAWSAGRGRWIVFAVVAAGMLTVTLWKYGIPSEPEVRQFYCDAFGRYTSELLSGDAQAFAGDYWTVWPAVFHANLTRHEQGGGPVMVGVALRGQAWVSRWRPLGDLVRVAVPREQVPTAEAQARLLGFSPFIPAGESHNLKWFRSQLRPQATRVAPE